MSNVKVIPPELLHPGECYLGRHKKGGIYVFRYLGDDKWSAGMFIHTYLSQVPDSHPCAHNTHKVDAFIRLMSEETVEEACQSTFSLSLNDVAEEIAFLVSLQNNIEHEYNLCMTAHFKKQVATKKQYKVINVPRNDNSQTIFRTQ